MTRSEPMDTDCAITALVAYHGAGRAVVASALGQEVFGMSVQDGTDSVWHGPPEGHERDPDVELVILLAGRCAESELTTLVSHALETWPGERDVDIWLETIRDLESGTLIYCPDADGRWPENDALALAWALGPVADCERLHKLDAGRRSAHEILAREWGNVEAIAECLGARLSRQPS